MTDRILLGDIDIDCADRQPLLACVKHVSATIYKQGEPHRHNTGVYFHTVPELPFQSWCSMGYEQAEHAGCYKIDLLHNHVYQGVRSEQHLVQLMNTEPMWELLTHEEVCKDLVHVHNHVKLVQLLRPQSVTELAMLLALIRPGKRHLVSKCEQSGWNSLEPEIWQVDNSGYAFKKSHAISLAMTIIMQLNLQIEQLTQQPDQLFC